MLRFSLGFCLIMLMCLTGEAVSYDDVVLTTPIIPIAKRPAAEACNETAEGLQRQLHSQILNGSTVSLNLYPHMAAIGDYRLDEREFDFRCGGSLIAKKFVLCAAHCARNRTHVLLGVVDLSDIKNGVIIAINKVHVHPNFNVSSSYNDIALLELENEVQYTANIYPICLFTDNADLTEDAELIVTGWGVDTTNRYRSDILLKSKVNLMQSDVCTREIESKGPFRRLKLGIQNTQICIKYAEPGICAGGSGGPLVLVENSLKYRLVGIVSAGFPCHSNAPEIYTRIPTFLEFIENIVWPYYGIDVRKG